jgi:hypothetical protein
MSNVAVLERRETPGGSVIVSTVMTLPPGWNKQQTRLWFVLPVAFPGAQPDCFFTEPDLRLANGAQPSNTGFQVLDSQQLLWFSWHLGSWNPARDSADTYVRFIERRFADVR